MTLPPPEIRDSCVEEVFESINAQAVYNRLRFQGISVGRIFIHPGTKNHPNGL